MKRILLALSISLLWACGNNQAPLIGITCSRSGSGATLLSTAYTEAVSKAGGTPVVIPTVVSAAEAEAVVGLRYHCTVHDCGKIVGIVKPEPSNVHDPRAQAVIRSDGKLLGYIPRTQLDWYEEFNEENLECPFVGEIELDKGSAGLIAEIKVIIPVSREYVEEEIQDEL